MKMLNHSHVCRFLAMCSYGKTLVAYVMWPHIFPLVRVKGLISHSVLVAFFQVCVFRGGLGICFPASESQINSFILTNAGRYLVIINNIYCISLVLEFLRTKISLSSSEKSVPCYPLGWLLTCSIPVRLSSKFCDQKGERLHLTSWPYLNYTKQMHKGAIILFICVSMVSGSYQLLYLKVWFIEDSLSGGP